MLGIIKDIATTIGVAIALATLIKGIVEYSAQGSQKRAEDFFKMRERFTGNKSFQEISHFLKTDDKKLRGISYDTKHEFLGCIEEVALLVNSKIINPKVAHYMFGWYATECLESEHFWKDQDNPDAPDKDGVYWALFNDFAIKMIKIRDRSSYSSRELRRLRFQSTKDYRS